VSLRKECAGFAQIPPGARVMPGGFNLLHGVVGPSLDRILTEPLPAVHDATELVAALRAQQATWLVTSTDNDADRIAASAGSALIDHGAICQGAELWQLAP
jgi:hypothetical protein